MIKKTAHQMVVGDAWDAFMTRKVLTTTWTPGFVHDAVPVRFQPLRDIIATLLYVDLVSLLDAFCESQMPPTLWKKLGTVEKRLKALKRAGKLLDFGRLHAMNVRRHEIAHNAERMVELAELDEAIVAVQRQLESWNLVAPAQRYEPFVERAEWTDSKRPGYIGERHWTVGVKRQGGKVLTVQWDELLASDAA